MYELFVIVASTFAGAVAAIAGFGIGSLLTPLLAVHLGTKLAVAAASIPHLIGTLVRFLTLRQHVDRAILIRFGLVSALGGLIGALLNAYARTPLLTVVLGLLLIVSGLTGMTGVTEGMRFGRKTAWSAGVVSGLFGGLVGNQGGLRAAALLGFEIQKESFVATAAAIALIVDGARIPVYLFTQSQGLSQSWFLILLAVGGVLAGTLLGARVLRHLPEAKFRRIVSAIIFLLGLYVLGKAFSFWA